MDGNCSRGVIIDTGTTASDCVADLAARAPMEIARGASSLTWALPPATHVVDMAGRAVMGIARNTSVAFGIAIVGASR